MSNALKLYQIKNYSNNETTDFQVKFFREAHKTFYYIKFMMDLDLSIVGWGPF